MQVHGVPAGFIAQESGDLLLDHPVGVVGVGIEAEAVGQHGEEGPVRGGDVV